MLHQQNCIAPVPPESTRPLIITAALAVALAKTCVWTMKASSTPGGNTQVLQKALGRPEHARGPSMVQTSVLPRELHYSKCGSHPLAKTSFRVLPESSLSCGSAGAEGVACEQQEDAVELFSPTHSLGSSTSTSFSVSLQAESWGFQAGGPFSSAKWSDEKLNKKQIILLW